MSTGEVNTILLNIYERLGRIETQLKDIEKLEDQVKDLEEFRGRVGAYLWIGGSIVSGALVLLYKGIEYGIDKWLKH